MLLLPRPRLHHYFSRSPNPPKLIGLWPPLRFPLPTAHGSKISEMSLIFMIDEGPFFLNRHYCYSLFLRRPHLTSHLTANLRFSYPRVLAEPIKRQDFRVFRDPSPASRRLLHVFFFLVFRSLETIAVAKFESLSLRALVDAVEAYSLPSFFVSRISSSPLFLSLREWSARRTMVQHTS